MDKAFSAHDERIPPYVEELLEPEDDVLREIRYRSTAAGLPEIAVGPFDGRHLELIARAAADRKMVEIGTLGGYSTVCLARALPTGGMLHTFELEPEHDEIVGSLAHCVARLGDLEEAKSLAELAKEKGPCNPDHEALLAWIEAGATDAPAAPATVRRPPTDRVVETVQLKMGEAGFSREEIERATQLWTDMQAHCELRITKPEVLAAALEYAIAVVERRPGCTQAEIARRYGVAPTSVSARFAQIRNALALRPGDPRYAASR